MSRLVVPSGPPDRPSPWAPASEIGGYRLVRRLGENEHVVTWLARGDDETVVLRVFRGTAPDVRIDAELGARERLRGPHVPELIDVATSRAGRPVAVVQAVVGPLLSDVLGRATTPLRAGHVTTILAPLAALLDAAHELGASLGRIDAGGIRVDPSGAPVVVAFGSAAIAAPLPERFRDQEPAIRADRAALAAFGSSLASLVDERERDAVLAALSASTDPRALELALFDCAAPLPIESLQAAADAAAAPAALGPTAGALDGPSAARSESASSRASQQRGASPEARAPGALNRAGSELGLPAGLLAPVDTALESLGAAVRARLGAMRSAVGGPGALARPRRGVVLAGVAGLLALGASVLLASAEQPSASSALDASPSAAPDDAEQAGPEQSRSVPSSSASSSTASADAPESLLDPAPEEWAPLVGVLVERWIACAPAPQLQCVDAVAHSGSGAAETLAQPRDDVGAVESLAALQEWAIGERHVVVVDRMGAAALVELLEGETATASLLMVRSEAGWRVRAVMP